MGNRKRSQFWVFISIFLAFGFIAGCGDEGGCKPAPAKATGVSSGSPVPMLSCSTGATSNDTANFR